MRVALTLVLLAVVGAATASAAPQPRIVFAADRAATRNGEIYSVDLVTRKTRDISRSLADDTGPAVSPDGTWIAFGSARGGTLGLYVSRIDGSGIRLVKLFHAGLTGMTVRWSPDGTRLAAESSSELWVGPPSGGGWTRWDAAGGYGATAWSPDGRFFAYAARDFVSPELTSLNVVDTKGGLAWRRDADQLRDIGWSADDRLAWMTGTNAHLAAESGASLAGFTAQGTAWSPDGRTLAVLHTRSVELRAAGVGPARIVYRGTRLSVGINWLGAHHVVVGAPNDDGYLRVDVRTGEATPAGYQDVDGVVSPDERELVSEYWQGPTYRGRQLRVGPLLGSGSRVLAQTMNCPDDHADPFVPVQFVPGTRTLIYVAECGDPTADVYSMRGDGTGLRQLTFTAAHEETPVLSPDGTRIAYVRSNSIGHACAGCPSGLWVMNADGSHPRRLTYPLRKGAIGDWDANPSWSPDGKWILFDLSESESITGLFVISADGGTPRWLRIFGSSHGVWGPHRIAYAGYRGAIWTAAPDGSDRHLIAPRHTCDSGCSFAWTPKGLAYATVRIYVTHSTLWIRGAGSSRRVQLPFHPREVEWVDGGRTLLVTAPVDGNTGQWSEGDVYRVEPDGMLTRLTTGLGAVTLG